MPPANRALYQANLEAIALLDRFPEQKGPINPSESETVRKLESSEATPIPIEDSVVINGMKNPICAVIIGFAGRQTLEAIRRLHKTVMQVVIIEPSLSIFKQTAERVWIGDLIRDENCDLLVGIPPEQILPHLVAAFTKNTSKGPIAHQCFTPEVTFDPFIYLSPEKKPLPIADQIASLVKEASKLIQISMGCASDSHYRYEQLIRNEKNLECSYRVAPFFEKFKELPAFVLGAGPSLTEFIDAAKELEKRGTLITDQALVIACDASLRRLLDHNIKPHLVTRCERKLTQVFQGITQSDTKGIFLAAYPWVAPEFFDLFDEKIMLYRGNGVCKFSRPYDFGDIDGGVSAANAGLELAFMFQAREIYLSGIDLVMIDGKTHCEGTQVEFNPENSKAKWTEVDCNDGEKRTTIPVWARCRSEYQAALLKHQNKVRDIFNASVKGAKIAGSKPITWNEILDRISRPVTTKPMTLLRSHLEKHPPAYAASFQDKKKKAIEVLTQAKEDLVKLSGTIEDSLLLNGREEKKSIMQLKSYSEPQQFWNTSDQLLDSMAKIYAKPAHEIDLWKQKYYTNDLFAQMILDICMIDLNSSEHKLASLKNLMKRDYERLKFYVGIHRALYETYHFYIDQLIKLMKTGPDQSVSYHNLDISGVEKPKPGEEITEDVVTLAQGMVL